MKEVPNMKFRSLGGSRQAVLDSPEALRQALNLDPAQWAMTGIRSSALLCDPDFLDCLDPDKSGRIRIDDVRELLKWCLDVSSSGDGFVESSPELSLADLNRESVDGKRIFDSARAILRAAGKPETSFITLELAAEYRETIVSALLNGDGVIQPDLLEKENPNDAAYAAAVMKAVGKASDRSGGDGVDLAHLDSFRELLDAQIAWRAAETPDLHAFGARTAEVFAEYSRVESAIEHFFRSCRALTFSRSTQNACLVSNRFDPMDASSVDAFFEKAPLAPANPLGVLSLADRINPRWADALKSFFAAVGVRSMSFEEWEAFRAKIAPYAAWRASKNTDAFDEEDDDALRALRDNPADARIRDLIEQDKSVAETLDSCTLLRKLILCRKSLFEFLNNVVSMSALFQPWKPSMILAGRLVMDGRHFLLCTIVDDLASHKSVIDKSDICVLYLNVSSPDANPRKEMTVAAAVTSGTMQDLYVGKYGVFFTRDGKVWDACITDVVRQPVSVWEAVKQPFRQFSDFFFSQIDKVFAAKSKNFETQVATDIQQTGTGASAKSGMSMPMLLMGGGVGIAALGSAFALIAKTLKGVSLWHVLGVLLAILLIFGAPVVLASLSKLFHRNLAVFFEANGYAVNHGVRMSLRLGAKYTYRPEYPTRALHVFLRVLAIFVCVLIGVGIGFAIWFFHFHHGEFHLW